MSYRFPFPQVIFSSLMLMSSPVIAQSQELLELPGTQASDTMVLSPVQQLELLTPDEISELTTPDSSDTQDPGIPVTMQPQPEPMSNNDLPDLADSPPTPPGSMDAGMAPTTLESTQEGDTLPMPPDLPLETPDEYGELMDNLGVEEPAQPGEIPSDLGIKNVWNYPSMMLSPKEVKIFNAAILRYLRSKNKIETQSVETTAAPTETGPASGNYPFITLDSIMFINDANWIVWINRHKYTPQKDEVLAGIKVEEVKPESVTLRWRKPDGVDNEFESVGDVNAPMVIVPGVNQEVLDAAATPKTPKPLPANVEKVDDKNYLITLSPNQAFITEDVDIYEGRAVNARIRQIYQARQRAKEIQQQASTIPGAPPGAVDPAATAEQEDVAKLLELYQNSGDAALNKPPRQ